MKIKTIKMLKRIRVEGLKVQVKTTNSDTKDKDIIISQSPKQTEVNEGSTVELMVSKGKIKKDSKEDSDSSDDKKDNHTTSVKIIRKLIIFRILEMMEKAKR